MSGVVLPRTRSRRIRETDVGTVRISIKPMSEMLREPADASVHSSDSFVSPVAGSEVSQ